uniref:HEAT repeat-containing protein 1 n=1 Tax=Oncorhynchus mykiss TaxID=8022 RepID=A0A8C7TUI6_ONCMY
MSVSFSHSQLDPLMGILKEHIGHMEKDQLTSHQSELTYFLISLDFRAQHCQTSLCFDCCFLSAVGSWEEVLLFSMDFTVSQNVLELELQDKSTNEGAWGHAGPEFTSIMHSFPRSDKAFFDTEDNIEKSCPLLEYILDCLHKICLYDTKCFVSTERANALMTPLVDQLNTLGGEEVYHTRVTKHLVLCTLNYNILLKTRHSSAKVRYLGHEKDYMVLLPGTAPFLNSWRVDECEKVEHQVQKIIHEMENILGEPLLSYL